MLCIMAQMRYCHYWCTVIWNQMRYVMCVGAFCIQRHMPTETKCSLEIQEYVSCFFFSARLQTWRIHLVNKGTHCNTTLSPLILCVLYGVRLPRNKFLSTRLVLSCYIAISVYLHLIHKTSHNTLRCCKHGIKNIQGVLVSSLRPIFP